MSSHSPEKTKVLLIGWDGADWKAIHPLMDAGKMPALERFVNQGVMGNLATLQPPLSPMLWTSVATGKRPFKHGVLGFTEPLEGGRGIRPVSGMTRKTKALWNIFTQNGLRSNVVGWWPSHPAEPILGAMVSDHYHRSVGPREKPWPMHPGSVYPQRLTKIFADLRFHPQELSGADLKHFIPDAARIDQEKDHRLLACARILAECATIHGAATWLMEHAPWNFMAVYYDAIDHFSHGFMKYHPPRQDFIPEADYERYKGVVEAGYRFHDMMLHTLLAMAGEDTVVILISDHGFHPDHLRPRRIPQEPAGPALEHSDFGIIAMKGPGIRKDQTLYGAGLLDITPTILTLFGLPIGEDMDGRPLIEAFEAPPTVEKIPTWETVPGDAGQHPTEERPDPLVSQEAIDQLVALGYIDRPDQDVETAINKTVDELRYNLARSYMAADRHRDAVPILEALHDNAPEEYRFGVQLALCYRAVDRIPDLRRLVDTLRDRRREDAVRAKEKLAEMEEMIRNRLESRAAEKKQEDNDPAPLLDPKEQAAFRKLTAQAQVDTAALDYLTAFVLMAEGDGQKALEHLHRAEKQYRRMPGLHLQIGEAYFQLKRWPDAERAYRKAAEIDPDSPHAHLGLSRCYLKMRDNRLAAREAKTAAGLLYHLPMAHYCLGIALHREGRFLESAQALERAVVLNPEFRLAHLLLAFLHRHRLKNPDKAAEHRRIAREIAQGFLKDTRSEETGSEPSAVRPKRPRPQRFQRPPSAGDPARVVTIVSGLPRSGTSMMMKMLASGGMELLTDGVRKADPDNPEGYFEFEPVKRTRKDPAWLEQAAGKTVKMVHMLLPDLPVDRPYRVVMMHRNIDEVVASQGKMLNRKRKKGGNLPASALKRAFQRQMTQVQRYIDCHPCFETIHMDYNGLLRYPHLLVTDLLDRLGLTCGPNPLISAIDPDLYRCRAEG